MTNDTVIQQIVQQVPWNKVLDLVLGALALVLGIAQQVVRARLVTSSKTLDAAIAGVENSKGIVGNATAFQVKLAIQSEAIKAGVEDHLQDRVQEVTKKE